VQYASATGTGTFAGNVTNLSGTLQPGQYYLVQQASGGTAGSLLPTPDASGTTNMSGTAGKVVLARTTAGLACNGGSSACDATQLALIIDLVGYGNANFFEGAGPAPAPTNTTAVRRRDDGCADTNNNAADFERVTPTPRNSSSPVKPCAVGSPAEAHARSPATGGTLRPVAASLLFPWGEFVEGGGRQQAAFLLVTFNARRPSADSTRWRTGAWACGPRGRRGGRPRPRGAWP
jgi:hypothetical protein